MFTTRYLPFAGRLMIGVCHKSGEGGRVGSARKALNLNPARRITAKARVPRFHALAFELINIGIQRAAIIMEIERAVGEHVEAGAEGHPCSGRTRNPQPHDAVKRLPTNNRKSNSRVPLGA